MEQYQRLTIDEARKLSFDELIKKYNDAVEDIWYLNYKIKELHEEVDLWQLAYDKVSDELYG